MTPYDAFLREIKHNPADDSARLVFADWLEEQDDPHGEHLRVQVSLDSLSASDPHRASLVARERAILQRYGLEWVGPLWRDHPEGSAWHFARGTLHLKIDAYSALHWYPWAEGPQFRWVESLQIWN